MVKKIVLLMVSLFFSTVHCALYTALSDSTASKKNMVDLEGLKNAIKEGSGACLRECVKKGLINNHELIKDEDFPVFFYTLCFCKKFGRAKEVLKSKNNFDVNFRGFVGKTSLHLVATYSKDADLIEILVNKGADKDALDDHKLTPLHYAVSFKMENNIKRILELGVKTDLHCDKIDKYTRYKGWTPLHFAVDNFHPAMKLLLDAGADINAVDAQGNTPLYVACLESKVYCVKFLLEAGANYECKNRRGYTPLHGAASVGDHLSVKELLMKGANVNEYDLFGSKTLLSMVIDYLRSISNDLLIVPDVRVTSTVKLLLDGGAKLESLDKKLLERIIKNNSKTKIYKWVVEATIGGIVCY